MSHPLLSPPVAELAGVVKRRGRVTALDRISLDLAPGQVTALLGPNGAGKSTAVAVLTGRLAPDAGQARLFSQDPRDPASRQRLGVMLQQAGMPRGLTVVDQLDLFRGYYRAPRPREEALAIAQLQGLEHRRCTALSGGQQRRLQFALAISGRPDFLILDEPSAGLDVESRRAMWAAVRAEADRGVAILLTTHYLDEAEALADRVVLLQAGQVVADGSPEGLKLQAGAGAVRCRSTLAKAALGRLSGAVSVRRDGQRLTVLTTTPVATLRQLLDLDPQLDDLTVSAASLEDAFARLGSDISLAKPGMEEMA